MAFVGTIVKTRGIKRDAHGTGIKPKLVDLLLRDGMSHLSVSQTKALIKVFRDHVFPVCSLHHIDHLSCSHSVLKYYTLSECSLCNIQLRYIGKYFATTPANLSYLGIANTQPRQWLRCKRVCIQLSSWLLVLMELFIRFRLGSILISRFIFNLRELDQVGQGPSLLSLSEIGFTSSIIGNMGAPLSYDINSDTEPHILHVSAEQVTENPLAVGILYGSEMKGTNQSVLVHILTRPGPMPIIRLGQL